METYGVPGGIQVTAAAYERLRDRYGFTARRLENVKGKGDMMAYLLSVPGDGSAAPPSGEAADADAGSPAVPRILAAP
jgi:hypothetical protein